MTKCVAGVKQSLEQCEASVKQMKNSSSITTDEKLALITKIKELSDALDMEKAKNDIQENRLLNLETQIKMIKDRI
jgi:hypothetical protein